MEPFLRTRRGVSASKLEDFGAWYSQVVAFNMP